MIISIIPSITKIFNSFYDFITEYFNNIDRNIVQISFPVHEIKLTKDNYNRESRKANIYSLNYLGLNYYILNNLKNIKGINELMEIMNTDFGYYAEETSEKNFFLVPYNCEDIVLENKNNIQMKISTNYIEDDDDDSKNKEKKSKKKVNNKTYDIILYIKCSKYHSEKLSILNNFIEKCEFY